jgi:hypothetical protein
MLRIFLNWERWVGDLPNEPNWPDSLKCFAFLEETKVMGIDWRKFYFGIIYFSIRPKCQFASQIPSPF